MLKMWRLYASQRVKEDVPEELQAALFMALGGILGQGLALNVLQIFELESEGDCFKVTHEQKKPAYMNVFYFQTKCKPFSAYIVILLEGENAVMMFDDEV